MFHTPINRWWTVVAGALGCAVGAGVVATYVLGIFVKSISHEFGWDRSFTTAGLSCFFIVSGIGSLVLGSIMSRWSMRSVVLVFVTLFALMISSVALLPPSVLLFCLVFSLMGFFGSAATAMPYAIAISRQFDKNRGLALAIMVSGSGVGALLMPHYANMLLQTHGWRVAYAGIGALVGVVSIFGLLFCFRSPAAPLASISSSEGFKLFHVVLTSKPFWIIAMSIFSISIALVGLITNLVPVLTDRGLTTTAAASMVGFVGAASWVSRLGLGVLLDRIHAKYVAASIFFISALGIAMLTMSSSDFALVAAITLIGLGIGAEADLLTFMMSRYFTAKALPSTLGAVWLCWGWGNGLGVFAGSLCFDLTGSYAFALFLFFGLAMLAGLLILQLGPYVSPHHGAESPAVSGSH